MSDASIQVMHDAISAPARLVIVTKTPLIERLDVDALQRLTASGAADGAVLRAAAARHHACLAAVRAATAGHDVREITVEAVIPGEDPHADAIITVGGDGTVFTAATFTTTAPYLTVNSDPVLSVGNFTRVRAAGFSAALALLLAGRCPLRLLARLELRVPGAAPMAFLNDCLFANPNPAAMCRYLLETPDGRSRQRSSGVWISTACGSTGAIRSAGMTPSANPTTAAETLMFKVREPFQPEIGAQLEGEQTPPQWLKLTPASGDAVCFLDGPIRTIPVAPGDTAIIAPSLRPLRLCEP